MMGVSGRAVVHDHLQKIVAKQISGEMRKDVQGRRKPLSKMQPDLLAQYVASTFILVLKRWVESRNPLPPLEADSLFHTLVMPTLTAALS